MRMIDRIRSVGATALCLAILVLPVSRVAADAKMTLPALNQWAGGASADVGIGNRPQDNPDWTFAANAGSYNIKRLRVLVRLR